MCVMRSANWMSSWKNGSGSWSKWDSRVYYCNSVVLSEEKYCSNPADASAVRFRSGSLSTWGDCCRVPSISPERRCALTSREWRCVRRSSEYAWRFLVSLELRSELQAAAKVDPSPLEWDPKQNEMNIEMMQGIMHCFDQAGLL